jgi:hypothetical protein
MQLLKSATIAATLLLTLSSAVAIPAQAEKEAADGIWTMHQLPDGTMSEPVLLLAIDPKAHDYGHDNSTSSTSSDGNNLVARSFPDAYSGCSTHDLNQNDFFNARFNMNWFCNHNGGQVAGRSVVYQNWGSAQAYLCNYMEYSQSCSQGEYDDVNTILDASCGANRAGYVGTHVYGKSYGRDQSGFTQCGF